MQTQKATRVLPGDTGHWDGRGQNSHSGQGRDAPRQLGFGDAFSSSELSPVTRHVAPVRLGPALSPQNMSAGPSLWPHRALQRHGLGLPTGLLSSRLTRCCHPHPQQDSGHLCSLPGTAEPSFVQNLTLLCPKGSPIRALPRLWGIGPRSPPDATVWGRCQSVFSCFSPQSRAQWASTTLITQREADAARAGPAILRNSLQTLQYVGFCTKL